MHGVSVGIADAEFVVMTELTLNRQVTLLGVGILKVPRMGSVKGRRATGRPVWRKFWLLKKGLFLGSKRCSFGR